MTFEELQRRLPNGFHDAAIRSISLDFTGQSIVIGMDLYAGVPGDQDPERYRPGTLRVASPYLFFMEAPDPRYRFVPNGSPINVDGDFVKAGQSAEVDRLLPVLPQNATAYRFFLEEWNSFVYLAGGDVTFSWDDSGLFEPVNSSSVGQHSE
ncbi:MAG TPA: hypothetical protein VFP96_03245 [Candidatus Acidoferrum sp.]|nr:hypothetical protein [Candidatus Acidoferrum sp.]HKS75218.1 hypothetical protein [Terriglobales bacterium]